MCIRFKWVNQNYSHRSENKKKKKQQQQYDGVTFAQRRSKSVVLCVVFGSRRVTRVARFANSYVGHTLHCRSIAGNRSNQSNTSSIAQGHEDCAGKLTVFHHLCVLIFFFFNVCFENHCSNYHFKTSRFVLLMNMTKDEPFNDANILCMTLFLFFCLFSLLVRFPQGSSKHFITHSAITCSVQTEDIVACVLLLYNPITKCPLHIHAYRCDSESTAQALNQQLQVLINRPENQKRFAELEARYVL